MEIQMKQSIMHMNKFTFNLYGKVYSMIKNPAGLSTNKLFFNSNNCNGKK